ncbi:transcriptional regulator, LacI family [Coriobacterium glomerans PW2]|uniref:Transcriptional regulator, LacI family n=1 Tax=Coriobacterium glomerans (strain ATCC 49209 / DSM 20642 / JCM 10262 / PW2) TaxID=700015 RepID=F2N8D3_CORGP|nr:LacI family DNA-binding transcriptional regulator [Coriobacterium glomerans]AEB07316.1 transcriptional regulator, LacI family [Coriobacterium glomerans PW2]
MDIRDIARLSGYSLGTVSRVLNGRENVSERARARVLEVVEAHGYEPNENARFLKMQEATSVVVFVKGTRNMLFADILERIMSQLAETGEQACVSYLDEDADEVRSALRFQQIRHPKGMIFLGGDPAFFERSFARIEVPCVLITNTVSDLGFRNLSSFSTDDTAAAREIVGWLGACGHERIGIIGGSLTPGQISYRRLMGAQNALDCAGIDLDFERDYEPCRYSMEAGYEAIVRLLARSPDITAVFALGDVIALGAARAVFDMGRRIPEDLSLAGFDGIASSQFSVPRLTTICQDSAQLASRGVVALLRAMAAEVEPVHEVVPFKLYKRESVRPLS